VNRRLPIKLASMYRHWTAEEDRLVLTLPLDEAVRHKDGRLRVTDEVATRR